MKLVREHINEKFSDESDPIRDMGIGKVPYNYHNLYIAKYDIEYDTNYITHKKVKVPKGTVIIALGGGMYGNHVGNIKIEGNINKVNGKSTNNYDIRKDKNNYTEIYYDVWEKLISLNGKIENWFRDYTAIESAAKAGSLDKVIDVISHQDDVIKKIEELLK